MSNVVPQATSADRVLKLLFFPYCCFVLTIPGYAACPRDSQLEHVQTAGIEMSRPLTAMQVEALTQTGPGFSEVSGARPYGPENHDWQELKAKQRPGDYFVQFWRGAPLVERTKFYMDGLYLVRGGCIVGWLKGTVN